MRNRLIGVTIGLLAAVIVLLWQSSERPQSSYRLLAENKGTISTIAVQYTVESAPYSRPCLREFFRQIGQNVEIIGVCGTKDDAASFIRDVRSWSIARSERVKTIVVGRSITGWCKDRFLVTGSGGLIHPPRRETGLASRTDDSFVAPAIAKWDGKRFSESTVPLVFDSGDIVATGRVLIVSDTLARKNPDVVDLDARLGELFGLKVIHLRGVPDHHIGMFAAPLDEKTILVSDPSLGGKPTEPSVQKLFDNAAGELRSAGFRVVRIPTIYLGPQTYITYTNAVFETDGRNKVVYMPVYEIGELDKRARAIYEGQGWTVRPIPVRTVYRFRGTIGCLVNVLERH